MREYKEINVNESLLLKRKSNLDIRSAENQFDLEHQQPLIQHKYVSQVHDTWPSQNILLLIQEIFAVSWQRTYTDNNCIYFWFLEGEFIPWNTKQMA